MQTDITVIVTGTLWDESNNPKEFSCQVGTRQTAVSVGGTSWTFPTGDWRDIAQAILTAIQIHPEAPKP